METCYGARGSGGRAWSRLKRAANAGGMSTHCRQPDRGVMSAPTPYKHDADTDAQSAPRHSGAAPGAPLPKSAGLNYDSMEVTSRLSDLRKALQKARVRAAISRLGKRSSSSATTKDALVTTQT